MPNSELTDQAAVRTFFAEEKPEYVILAAARVGGIHANNIYPAEFIYQNLVIKSNIIHSAWQNKSAVTVSGTSCIYPRIARNRCKEECLLTGMLEPTNRPYALAKIAGIEMCWHTTAKMAPQYMAVMPTNLYGPGDNYDLNNSHVLPALIRKMHEAKLRGDKEVVVWGTGTPKREFLYSEDMADACIFLLERPQDKLASLFNNEQPPLVNIGCGEDLTIRELAELVAEVVEFKGSLIFDTSKPDGTMRKVMDVSKIGNMGWKPKTDLHKGISLAYEAFLDRNSQ